MDHITDSTTSAFEERWHFSHVVRSRGLLFLSGVTGTDVDGVVSPDPETQFEQTFIHLRQYLTSAGAGMSDLVEITSYHVDIDTHLDVFVAVKDRHIGRPFPAWSAIGATGLITPGALVEVRAVAEDPRDGTGR